MLSDAARKLGESPAYPTEVTRYSGGPGDYQEPHPGMTLREAMVMRNVAALMPFNNSAEEDAQIACECADAALEELAKAREK